ncbi:MAG: hypothetical protein HZA01_09980 [Nitrospinae bacterium]|nr:hypothetical protein [Nitrospinota bacterium]
MPSSLGNVGDANIAAVERQAQKRESASRERDAAFIQQINSRTVHGSDERRRRQVESVESSKGQNISINA